MSQRKTSTPDSSVGLLRGEVTVGCVRLHYAEAGRGEPVVLLHGFPEFWYSWRHQLPALADAGFRAVAPDLRGYNESDRPAGRRRLPRRAARRGRGGADPLACGGRACVVGHDWGGVLAWRLAAIHPGLVRKLAILNAPHPPAFRRELRRDWRQCLRSAYTLFFQLPRLPEWLLRAGDFALLRRALAAAAGPARRVHRRRTSPRTSAALGAARRPDGGR